jgi:RNA polymerase sigma factor (sigma-70 family)
MMRALSALVGKLREAVRMGASGTLPDGELLSRWVQERDQAAFELLVWRHGRLVLSVCQRLLHNAQDVEDAFQATFLVLVRKAGSISRRQALASWLHTVAHRIALQARTRRGPVSLSETEVARAIAPETDLDRREVRDVLDEELRRLPEKYRVPFVLCYLEGRTNEEAARELGRPVGTIASRLARARARLRQRLARRGLAPSALCVAAPAAIVPAQLVSSTVTAALAVGARQAAGIVSGPALALMEGALQAMLFAKMKVATAVVVTVAILAGGGVVGYRTADAQPAGDTTPGRSAKGSPTSRSAAALQEQIEAVKAELEANEARTALLKKTLIQLSDAAKKAGSAQSNGKPLPASSSRGSKDRDSDLEVLRARRDVKKAELAVARASLDQAAERHARISRLVENKAASAETLSGAKAAVIQAEAQLKVKEAELRESLVVLQQAQRRAGGDRNTTTTTSTGRPRSLEQRVRDLEKKVEFLQRQLEQARPKGKGGSDRPSTP